MPQDAPDGATLDADRILSRDKPVNEAIGYHVDSALTYTLDPQLDAALRLAALQLPPDFDPRAIAMARSWRIAAGANDSAIVRDALRLFHDGGFVYNLAAPPLGRDSVDDFLFGTREGYCEHYAGAFVFLMRAAGVPARVVAGYAGGYWNAYAHYLLIRQSNAHAWAEVWLAGRGWVRVDPTAMVRRAANAGLGDDSGGSNAGGGWLLGLRDRFDIVNRLWERGVLGFDTLRQSRLLMPLGIPHAEWNQLAIALAVGALVILALGMLFALHRPLVQARDPLDAAQQRLQAKLARIDLERRPQEGPRDFFARCMLALPAKHDELAALARVYMTLRYGHTTPPAEPLRGYSRAVRAFRARRVVK